MQTGSKEVKMRIQNETRVVGTATYPIYDAVSEALGEEGEAKILEYINAQVRTNEMNRIRGMARGGPTKTVLRNKALASITADEWQQIAGDERAIEALIESKIEALRAEALAAVGVPADEDDEND